MRRYTGGGWPLLDTTDTYGHFTGAIDEVAVYDRPLSPQSVAQHYAARQPAGRMVRTTLPSGRVHAQVVYDSATDRAREVTEASGGTWKISAPEHSSGSAAYEQAVLASSPSGYWRLGDRRGAAAASALAEGTDGSYGEGVTLAAAGAFADGDDTAVSFDGSGSYAEIPGETLHGSIDVAVELWFKTGEPGVMVGDQSRAIDDPAGVGDSWTPVLYVGTDNKLHGKFYVDSSVTGTSLASTDTVTDNQWHHAVVSASGTTQTLYLDGVKQGTLTGAVNHQANSRTYIGAGFAKGGWPSSPGDISHFTGSIDEVAVYQHPLTDQQVSAHYRSAVESDTSALLSTVQVTDASRDTWQLDPMPSVQGNRYTYGNATPLNATDPTGHCVGPVIILCGIGAVSAAEALGWGIFGTVAVGGGAVVYDNWSRTGSGTTTGTYGQSSVLSNSYASSLSDAIAAQARAQTPTADKAKGDCTRNCGGGTGIETPWVDPLISALPEVVIPPRPPIIQNPKGPGPKVTRDPKQDWDPWKPTPEEILAALKTVFNAQDLIDMITGDDTYTPTDESPEALPAPGTEPGNGGGRDERRNDCRRGGTGWVEYGNLDSAHGNRATTMNSCLDKAYLASNKGSPAVGELAAGYQWAKDTVNDWGYSNDSYWVNACHLLSRALTGTGRNPANLSTCTRPANAMVRGADRIEENFRYYEKAVRTAIKNDQVVQYSVQPNYTGDRVVASSWTFNATAWGADGKPYVLFNGGAVRNELGGRNLGRQNDADGNPAPTGRP